MPNSNKHACIPRELRPAGQDLAMERMHAVSHRSARQVHHVDELGASSYTLRNAKTHETVVTPLFVS